MVQTTRKTFASWRLTALTGGLILAYATGLLFALYADPDGRWWLLTHLTLCGFPAIPLGAWLLSRFIDQQLDAKVIPASTAIWGRLGIGVAAVALLPLAWSLLDVGHLRAMPMVTGLASLLLGICVATGLLLVCFGLADGAFRLTSPFRHLSTRLMLLLVASALGTLFSVSLIGAAAVPVLNWAIERGGLEPYMIALRQVALITTTQLGGTAGTLVVELPLTLLLAWRFAQNATRSIRVLGEGFERVTRGELDVNVTICDNDEVAEMQRSFNAMLLAVRERRFLEAAFGRYVSPVLLAQLRERSADLTSMPGQRRVASGLFSDIRGFTAMSAALPPEEVIAILNAYMSLMIEVVARFDGYINKFVGDAVMVLWNAPLDQPKHALQAMACAQAMHDELQRANAANVFGPRKLEMGIGINSGPLVAGNLGNSRQTEFTVIGDTVNVASRACHQATADQVVLTSSVLEAAGWGAGTQVKVESLGVIAVKGKGDMELFTLSSSSQELYEALQQGTALRQLRPESEPRLVPIASAQPQISFD